MARIRYLKPGFFKNEDLAALSPIHRLAFAGLWVYADRSGRLLDRPRRLKIEILPYDDLDMDQTLADLATAGFIVRYQVDGIDLIEIPTFAEHQRFRDDEPPSKLPGAPRSGCCAVSAAVPVTGTGAGTGPGTDPVPSAGGNYTHQEIGIGIGMGSPPYPPRRGAGPVNGTKPTRAERKKAEELRRAWGRCLHAPRCPSTAACLAAIVSGWREQAADARPARDPPPIASAEEDDPGGSEAGQREREATIA